MKAGAVDKREAAIERAIIEVVGEDALDEEPDLVFVFDEILPTEGDHTIQYLAEAASEASYAENEINALRREENRPRSELTLGEQKADDAARKCRDALRAVVRDRVEDRIEDAEEWLGGDVSLTDLEGASQ